MFESLFPSHWTTLRKLMWLKLKGASAVWETISGNPVSFTAKAAPLRQLKVAFSPVQSGSGDPSPDNVRPISGWDSLMVYHSGADTSNPQTISISLGSTVYSGTVDVLTGVVTVDSAIETLNGTENWGRENLSNNTARFYKGRNAMKKYSSYTTDNLRSDILPTCSSWISFSEVTFLSVTGFTGTNVNNWIYVMSHYPTTGIETTDQLKAWLSENNLHVWYKLAEPLTIQLTPQEVESLAGDNVVWSTANGDLTVEYRSN